MIPNRITRSVQNLHRLQQIARVLTQHGFGHVVDQLDLGRFVPLWRRSKVVTDTDQSTVTGSALGNRLKRVACDLGPLFVKLGQMLATRPDLLPADIIDELRSLQDQSEPFDSALAKRMLADELGIPLEKAFQAVDDNPIATGSIGQVYRAALPDGQPVVIKIRRPNITQVIKSDLALLKWLAEKMESWMPESQAYRPTIIVEEFERTILRELDYLHEATTTARMHAAFEKDVNVTIPDVVWTHTTANVLTLHAVRGDNLDYAVAANGNRFNRKELAARIAELYLKQFFEIGTFHADPHAGNILVSPPAHVGLVDFGQIGVLSDDLIGHLVMMLYGAANRDADLVADALVEMGASNQRLSRRDLVRDLITLLDKYHGQPLRRIKVALLFTELAEVVRRHELTIPQDVVMMLKALGTVWGVGLKLDPELDLAALLRPRMAAMVRERLSIRRGLRATGITLWHLTSFLKAAPQQLREVLRQVSSGQWQLNVRHDNLETLSRDLDRSSNRLAFSIVIGAIVVGSSVVVSSNTKTEVLGIPLQSFGVFGYLFAGILGMGLLWAILRSGRLS